MSIANWAGIAVMFALGICASAPQADCDWKLLGERTVDLRNITMPVLNIYAENDHIIPPQTSRALGALVGTDDYTEIGLPGGHVGVFVSGKSQGVLGKGIVDWLRARS